MPTHVDTTGRCMECPWRCSTAEVVFSAVDVTRATERHERETKHATFVEGIARTEVPCTRTGDAA